MLPVTRAELGRKSQILDRRLNILCVIPGGEDEVSLTPEFAKGHGEEGEPCLQRAGK